MKPPRLLHRPRALLLALLVPAAAVNAGIQPVTTIISQPGGGEIQAYDKFNKILIGTKDGGVEFYSLANPAAPVFLGTNDLTGVFSGTNTLGNVSSVAGDATYNSTFGTPIFNPQTSLYEQKVSVANNTPFDFTALRITATNLPAGVTLRNASITNGGLAYIEYQLPVRSGSNVTLTLEYYNANRAGAVTPGLKLELLNSTRVIAPPANPVMAAVTGLRGYAPDGRIRFYIEFPTTVGLTYYVQYKDAVGVPWKTSPVVINGTGNRLNWLDDGAPNTDSPPSAGRFYRVITGN